MSRKIVFLAMMIFALGMVAFPGCGSKADNGDSGVAEGDGQVQASAPKMIGLGSPAPDFTLQKISGGELQLSTLRGKTVIVDFWDTWCPPCIRAMPHLQELSTEYSDDLVVVGIAMGREGEAKVKTFTKKHGLTFPIVMLNNDMKLLNDFGGVPSIPTTFLIDREGIIRERWVGAVGKATYETSLKAVLGS